jgi:S-adenosylmethionine:diacylglycerol 3-amino-3-carboxypropyl transferase
MYEDPAVELGTFAPGGRVFCIASAGCTAFALSARGDHVTAVDLNRTQIEYVRSRIEGRGVRSGAVDLAFGAGRRLLPLAGLTPRALRDLLELDDPRRQSALWRERFDTPLFRTLLRAALSRRALELSPVRRFLAVLPPRFGDVIRTRLARGIARHPNRANPFLWRIFLGRQPPGFADPVPRATIVLAHAEAVEYLEGQPARSFDGYSLSNIGDGADARFMARLREAIARTARPDARYVLRSFAAPRDDVEDQRARNDRSHLWGRIVIARAGE